VTPEKTPESSGKVTQHEGVSSHRSFAIRVSVAVVVVGLLALAAIPLVSFFFILIQIGQVFAAPIPGQVTGFIGGYLFGIAAGTAYATIGGTIGCSLVFVLSRRLGRPFVQRFVRSSILERFDFITSSHGAAVLFVIFLVPIFPDDLICYLAGLTRIPLRRLIVVALVGCIPGYAVFSATGAGVAGSNVVLVGILLGVAVTAVAVAFWQRKRIFIILQRLAAPRGNHTASP
jgi:uncharacterized membrane protein YdjX (TVP38/TMEM64 family)